MSARVRKPIPVRFQVSIRVRLPASIIGGVKKQHLDAIFLHWLREDEPLPGTDVKVIIWQGDERRTISQLDDSARGDTLRQVLRRALQNGRLTFRAMG
ncbi:MAG: hypothetical protein MN733_07285 [Nitrososphaera sp.]|nr:hypothetical protein [Nitrososphaera sp.]